MTATILPFQPKPHSDSQSASGAAAALLPLQEYLRKHNRSFSGRPVAFPPVATGHSRDTDALAVLAGIGVLAAAALIWWVIA